MSKSRNLSDVPKPKPAVLAAVSVLDALADLAVEDQVAALSGAIAFFGLTLSDGRLRA